MDIPPADGFGASLLLASTIAAVGWLGSQGIGWVSGVNDAVLVVDSHEQVIDKMLDNTEDIKVLAEDIRNNQARIEGKVEVIEDITLKNMELGQRFRERIEE